MTARMQNISSTAKGSANQPNELILPNSSKRRFRHIFVALLETALKPFIHCSRSSAGFLKRIARLRHFHLFKSVRHENGNFLSL
jgi:hypothetical protein